MSKHEGSSGSIAMTLLYGAAGMAAAVVIVGAAATLSPRQAQALPAYAAQTGFPCGKCHVNQAGGGPRNAYGQAFAANGHKPPADAK